MCTEPKSISDLISRWGTISAFAKELGCGYEAARKMKDRDSIAPVHWVKFVDLCKERGFSTVDLNWLAEKQQEKRTIISRPFPNSICSTSQTVTNGANGGGTDKPLATCPGVSGEVPNNSN